MPTDTASRAHDGDDEACRRVLARLEADPTLFDAPRYAFVRSFVDRVSDALLEADEAPPVDELVEVPIDDEFDVPSPRKAGDGDAEAAATATAAGRASADAADHRAALRHFRRAIEEGRATALTYSHRAEACLRLGKNDAAVAHCARALSLNGDCAKAHRICAHAHFARERFAECVRHCDAFLTLDVCPSVSQLKQRAAAATSATPPEPRSEPPRQGPRPTSDASSLEALMADERVHNVASSLMSDPDALQRIMADPAVARLLSSLGGA